MAGLNIFSLLKYLAREYLIIVSTSSSEAALPRLVAKMEHLGVSRPVVGIIVPTGYSFNLDGTAIYLTMASLFIAEALGTPLSLSEQISLLVFMMIASKGAAGVTGAGLAVLAGGLQSHRPDLVDGVGLIVGIDRFMSEARAVTNFSGNAVATVLIGKWVGEFDADQARRVLRGEDPFDEATMIDDDEPPRWPNTRFQATTRRVTDWPTANLSPSATRATTPRPPLMVVIPTAHRGPDSPPDPSERSATKEFVMPEDQDPRETQEWLDALDSVVEFDGVERAAFLLESCTTRPAGTRCPVPFSANTPYLNTIPVDKQPPHPGDREIEHRSAR